MKNCLVFEFGLQVTIGYCEGHQKLTNSINRQGLHMETMPLQSCLPQHRMGFKWAPF